MFSTWPRVPWRYVQSAGRIKPIDQHILKKWVKFWQTKICKNKNNFLLFCGGVSSTKSSLWMCFRWETNVHTWTFWKWLIRGNNTRGRSRKWRISAQLLWMSLIQEMNSMTRQIQPDWPLYQNYDFILSIIWLPWISCGALLGLCFGCSRFWSISLWTTARLLSWIAVISLHESWTTNF